MFKLKFYTAETVICRRCDGMDGSSHKGDLEAFIVGLHCTAPAFLLVFNIAISMMYAVRSNISGRNLHRREYQIYWDMNCVSAPSVRTNKASDWANHLEASSKSFRK